jgi:tRNA(adenine34) deaminase
MTSKGAHIEFMKAAIAEATLAAEAGEVPVGAIVVHDGKIISRAHNRVESATDATKHAEILAIQHASEALGAWRLTEASLYVTLEPCPMCIGATLLSRIKNLYFGCYDPRMGAVGSVFDISNHPELPHKVEVFPELLKDECLTLLKDFFKVVRSEH